MKIECFMIIVEFLLSAFTLQRVTGECNVTLDTWRNMTMEEILFRSDMVVYGRDKIHRKLRHPDALDSRFDVYCVIKTDTLVIPGEIVIESIDEDNDCFPSFQTKEDQVYILGLSRKTSGFARYANINPYQGSAFPPTPEHFERLKQVCELKDWTNPINGFKDKCPKIQVDGTCTKMTPEQQIRERSWWEVLFGVNAGTSLNISAKWIFLNFVCYLFGNELF